MKYLKLFEELKSETYYKVGNKLREIGHISRSKSMIDWAKSTSKKEQIEKWSKFGTFELSFYRVKYMAHSKSFEYKYLFSGQFHIGLQLDTDHFWEILSDIQSGNDERLFLILGYGVYPANKETEDNMISVQEVKDNYDGGYWDSNFSIKISEKNLNILPTAIPYFEPLTNISYLPKDRKSAIKFKKLINDIIEEKVIIPYEWHQIEKARRTIIEKTGKEELWGKIVNSVKNIPINYYYKN